jgi:hypothetical protein
LNLLLFLKLFDLFELLLITLHQSKREEESEWKTMEGTDGKTNETK